MYYVLFIYEDVEPQLYGPYDTTEDRDQKARELRVEEGEDHGIYMLDMDSGLPEVNSYSGAFFEEDDEEEDE